MTARAGMSQPDETGRPWRDSLHLAGTRHSTRTLSAAAAVFGYDAGSVAVEVTCLSR